MNSISATKDKISPYIKADLLELEGLDTYGQV